PLLAKNATRSAQFLRLIEEAERFLSQCDEITFFCQPYAQVRPENSQIEQVVSQKLLSRPAPWKELGKRCSRVPLRARDVAARRENGRKAGDASTLLPKVAAVLRDDLRFRTWQHFGPGQQAHALDKLVQLAAGLHDFNHAERLGQVARQLIVEGQSVGESQAALQCGGRLGKILKSKPFLPFAQCGPGMVPLPLKVGYENRRG